jgi:hypothetical protein
MMLLTKAQREQLLDNGRRQAAVKGTPDEIDFHPVAKLFDPCGAGDGPPVGEIPGIPRHEQPCNCSRAMNPNASS